MSGEEKARVMRESPSDVGSGREAIEKAAPSRPTLSYERFDLAREAFELGAMDYLLKPVYKDKLALSLRAAARSASTARLW
jgi:Response regulator containing CheY-like receiver domain and AraC-type DNA-binding domain